MKIIKPGYEILLTSDAFTALKHIEKCGRTCYKSEAHITTESALEFVKKRAIEANHASMLEHFSITVKFTCDLGISGEGNRHRNTHIDEDQYFDMEWNPAISQESTRFCNYSKNKFGNEITFIDLRHHFVNPASIDVWYSACLDAEKNYLQLIANGESPQFARSVLIRSTKTEMCYTANVREWRAWLKLRAVGEAGKPHPQMTEITIPLLDDFKSMFPVFFDDLQVKL